MTIKEYQRAYKKINKIGEALKNTKIALDNAVVYEVTEMENAIKAYKSAFNKFVKFCTVFQFIENGVVNTDNFSNAILCEKSFVKWCFMHEEEIDKHFDPADAEEESENA